MDRRGFQHRIAFVFFLVSFGISGGFAEETPQSNPAGLKDVECVVVDPISSRMILPDTPAVEGDRSTRLRFVACRDEFEPASFVLRPTQGDITGLKCTVSALTGSAGEIPASCVDIRTVKCWYQEEGAWKTIDVDIRKDAQARIPQLVPELLLRDDTLVKVDFAEHKNFLKLRFPDGETYRWISEPLFLRDQEVDEKRQIQVPLNSEFPVQDADVLQPVHLTRGVNKQFWVTIHVPQQAAAGVYRGSIQFTCDQGNVGAMDISLRVLPFDLDEPALEYSIYYHAQLVDDDKATISSRDRSKDQITAELKNMWDHGVRNPTLDQPATDHEKLIAFLELRQKTGMTNQPLYCISWDTRTDHIQGKDDIQKLVELTKHFKTIARQYGATDLYIYGICEATGDVLLSQREAWKTLREQAGVKIFVAGYRGTFETMGDLLDFLICANAPSVGEAKKFHGVGHRISCYANPQIGVENPYIFRRNFGIILWAAGYDGAMDYAYCRSFCHIWNDFDHWRFRDHNFVHPTVNGVIDTIAWEGFREAVDDVRYLTTLQRLANQATRQKNETLRAQAAEALEYLEGLKTHLPDDLTAVRLNIIDRILRIQDTTRALTGQSSQEHPTGNDSSSDDNHREKSTADGKQSREIVKGSVKEDSRNADPTSNHDTRVHVYPLKGELRLDGRLEDDEWAGIPTMVGFRVLGEELYPYDEQVAFFRIAQTRDAVVVGIQIHEDDVPSLMESRSDMDNLWLDDGAEVFFTDEAGKCKNHFIVNTAGARWCESSNGEAKDVLKTWQAKIWKEEHSWSMELSFPKSLVIPRGETQALRFAVCHNNPGAMDVWSSWPDMGRFSVVYNNPSHFAVLCWENSQDSMRKQTVGITENSDYLLFLRRLTDMAEKETRYLFTTIPPNISPDLNQQANALLAESKLFAEKAKNLQELTPSQLFEFVQQFRMFQKHLKQVSRPVYEHKYNMNEPAVS